MDMNFIIELLKEKLNKIPQIEYIFIAKEEDSIHIWSVINNQDREVKREIYRKEFEIMDDLPQLFFDFHVLIRNNRPIEEITPTKVNLIFSRSLLSNLIKD